MRRSGNWSTKDGGRRRGRQPGNSVRPPAFWLIRRRSRRYRGLRQAPWTSVRKPLKQTTWSRDRCDGERTSWEWTRPLQSWTGDQDLVARTVACREPKATAEASKNWSR
ncbi:hypothetical protein MRX96_048036 [Rhipicephalus microplus]